MDWWLWLVLGLILIGGEAVTPGGFFVMFFGAAALLVGALAWRGVAGPVWTQWLLFSILSVASLLLFRNAFLRKFKETDRGDREMDTLVGEVAIPAEDIAPGATGRAELRGTTWSVRNVDGALLARGQRCLVEKVEGLLLSIRADGGRS